MQDNDRDMHERLQKFLARAGVASRRECKEIIKSGRVRVDGQIVRATGFKLDPTVSRVEVGRRLIKPPRLIYLAMNKPRGVVTTMSDPQRRTTVKELLPHLDITVKPVGRLDYASEGLLLFTNDGDLLARLTHPRYGVWKTYKVTAKGRLDDKQILRLQEGVYLDGRRTSEARARIVCYDHHRDETVLEIAIHEGRKHQIRKMIEAVGSRVLSLKRTHIGPVSLGKLRPGHCRALTGAEVARLRRAVSL